LVEAEVRFSSAATFTAVPELQLAMNPLWYSELDPAVARPLRTMAHVPWPDFGRMPIPYELTLVLAMPSKIVDGDPEVSLTVGALFCETSMHPPIAIDPPAETEST